jgi:hypothetical protein
MIRSFKNFPQLIRMLTQYVLDNYFTSVLAQPLIVSRQLARFASSRASLRCLCDLSVSALSFPFFSLSGTDLDRSASAPNSLPLNLFADPHPLSCQSFTKTAGAGGSNPLVCCTVLVHSKFFRCNISESPPKCCKQRACAIPRGLPSRLRRASRGEATRHYICPRSFQFIQNPRTRRTSSFLLSY